MKPNLALILAITAALGALPLATEGSWAKGGGGGHGGGGHGGGHFAGGHGGGRSGNGRNAFGTHGGWNRFAGNGGGGWGGWGGGWGGWGGWVGPVFWPFLLGDIFSYVLLPYDYYYPFWSYGTAYDYDYGPYVPVHSNYGYSDLSNVYGYTGTTGDSRNDTHVNQIPPERFRFDMALNKQPQPTTLRIRARV